MSIHAHYRLVETIFFRKIGSVVYVHNVATGEDFIFSEDAGPIFVALRNGKSARASMLLGQEDFIRELHAYGIVSFCDEHDVGRATNLTIGSNPPMRHLAQNEDIVSRVQEECRKRHLLWSAGLELTYRCNERCRHCYCDLQKERASAKELTESEWLKSVDQLSRMGCMNVLVTGGEPTLHPAFGTICERIVNRGMLCDVYTNGLKISNRLFDSLCKLPLNSISVSLYSGTAAFHDEITGVAGSFQKPFATLMRFKEAGLNAYAKVPVFHGHLKDYFSAKELGRKNGFRTLASTILVPGHSGETRNPMMMSASEYEIFLKRETKPDTSVEKTSSIEKFRNEPLCQAGQSTLCISPFGDVMPCNSFPAVCGNVRQGSLAKIWRTSDVLKRLRNLRRCDVSMRCASCADIAYCTICPGASWSETHGRIVPCSWSCEQTRVRADFNRKKKRRKNEDKDDCESYGWRTAGYCP